MSEMVVGRSRRKAVASFGVALTAVAGALFFAEHDASARTLPRRTAVRLAPVDPVVIQNIAVPSTGIGGTTPTISLDQLVLGQNLIVDQDIQLTNCAAFLEQTVITGRLFIPQSIVFAQPGCAVPSG